MVSRVAVIALVAIVACPILLGYSMNLTQETVSDFKVTNDSVNVTPLLQSGVEYTTALGDAYQLNTNFDTSPHHYPVYPTYEKMRQTYKTSFSFRCNTTTNYTGGSQELTYCADYVLILDYDYSSGSYFKAEVYSDGTLVSTINRIIYFHYNLEEDKIQYVTRTGVNSTYENEISGGNYTSVTYTAVGGQTATRFWAIDYTDARERYTDLSGGFYFRKYLPFDSGYRILLPEQTNSVVLSINLGSITDSSYTATIAGFTFTKTTTGGQVNWNVSRSWWDNGHYETYSQDLYYNPDISNNTYQMVIKYPDESEPSADNTYPSPTYRHYHRYVEFRYVGSWQQLIGEANSYQTYDLDYWEYKKPAESYLDYVPVYFPDSGRSPTMRVDAAVFNAFQYNVIEDNTYDPSSFKTNPATTISDVQHAGTSLVFGGNTYKVTKGKITIDSHSIPVDGLVFSSVPNDSGTYDNMIGNTLISTTANPSTITFNGKWAASVSTASTELVTYTKTEWTPGQFGWDGIDQNFLMVGLLTSLGVFVALGIYIRRTKAALWPLMIVCGGAAMLFFIML